MILNEFLEWMKENNWSVIEKKDTSLVLNNLFERYPNIPKEYLEFLMKFKQIISPTEKTWFLCCDEYNNDTEFAFSWDEFEKLSLEVAADDEEWQEEIINWWNGKLPIMLSVEAGYSFYAIDLSNEYGCIVRGEEPEFEEVEKVADNFADFLKLIMSNQLNC